LTAAKFSRSETSNMLTVDAPPLPDAIALAEIHKQLQITKIVRLRVRREPALRRKMSHEPGQQRESGIMHDSATGPPANGPTGQLARSGMDRS
jgi:hypothetical protein